MHLKSYLSDITAKFNIKPDNIYWAIVAFLIVVLVVYIYFSSFGSNYVLIYEDNKISSYVNISSVKRNGDFITFELTSNGKASSKSSITTIYGDCEGRKGAATLKQVLFAEPFGKGKHIHTDNTPQFFDSSPFVKRACLLSK